MINRTLNRYTKVIFLALIAALIVMPTVLAPVLASESVSDKSLSDLDSLRIDRLTSQALDAMARHELPEARALLQDLVKDYPTFHLGHLLYAELHAANTSLPSSLDSSQYNESFIDLLLEAATRQRQKSLFTETASTTTHQPSDIVKLGTDLKHWVQVNLEKGTQTVFNLSDGKFNKLWEQYVGYGSGGYDKFSEGDLRTPLGIYRIDGYRSDASLPELYGSGALMLDYPNLADKYESRTGSGIWLHGVPRTSHSRGPLSSEGCVTMSNDYLSTLHELIEPNATLVALSSATAIAEPNIDLASLNLAFLSWQATHTSQFEANSEIDISALSWNNVTVAVSGASSTDGEPQNVVMYFSAERVASNQAAKGDIDTAAFKALFWQRQTPGTNNWVLIADEMNPRGT